ncbi:14 kDa zinc-binding protein-like isoform X2 [Phalaenopsis equestris]|uniref:14 kDa zinc-binding protein-like isoform X2 n=1 Tax=Phalaenopsis equestris TaxID=78828 RepID=UPI0009E42FC1|nr:14 kDa zinc-binding protein-like isoform X2 [Phalaenopsis equestris]
MAAALKVPLSIIRQPFALRSCATVRTITGLSAFTLQAPSLYLLRQRYARHYSASLNEEASARLADDSAESVAPTMVLAFRDIDPQAPVHVLVIPKIRDGLTQLGKAEIRHAEILGHLLYAAKVVAAKEGIEDGFRVVINNGPSACQSVYHLHLHVLGGRQMNWPPG